VAEKPAAAVADRAATSDKPAEAETPAAVDKPAAAEKPAEADKPAVADTEADKPAEAETPAAAENPAAVDKPAEADKPAVAEIEAEEPAEADKPALADTDADKPAAADKPAEVRVPVQSTPAPELKPAADAGRARPVLVPIALAALALASLVAVAVLGWQSISASRAQSAQNAALDAARTGTTQVLSYDSKTLDADLAKSRTLISGNFAAKFEDLANSVIVPAVRQQSLSTKANVVRAAIIDAQPEQVQALLFVNQTTSMSSQPAPRSATNQVRVTMTWSDGHWLISDVQPL
jgi:Mce-associated membrane protein